MSRLGTDSRIKEAIWKLAENNSKISAGQILIKLRASPLSERVPSERTIARIKRDFLKKEAVERRPYRFYSWPESIVECSLPWEASRAMWDLKVHCDKHGFGETTIREAQWFWRITLIAPDLNIAMRDSLAYDCAYIEEHSPKNARAFVGVESYLALSPWRSRKARMAYEKKVKDGVIPALPRAPRIAIKSIEIKVIPTKRRKGQR